MVTLQGEHIELRALEPGDLDFLYQLENDESIWTISNTIAPYSKFVLKKYLKNAHADIFESKQLRLVITLKDEVIGLIDLFNFHPLHKRAGIGVVIAAEKNRNKGYAKDALKTLISYCFKHLQLHQVYCNIGEFNKASIALFEQLGFEKCGIKKAWNLINGRYQNELMYQLINQYEL